MKFKKEYLALIFAILFALIVVIFTFIYFDSRYFRPEKYSFEISISKLGNLGDFLGGILGLGINAISIYYIYKTFKSQNESIRAQDETLKLSQLIGEQEQFDKLLEHLQNQLEKFEESAKYSDLINNEIQSIRDKEISNQIFFSNNQFSNTVFDNLEIQNTSLLNPNFKSVYEMFYNLYLLNENIREYKHVWAERNQVKINFFNNNIKSIISFIDLSQNIEKQIYSHLFDEENRFKFSDIRKNIDFKFEGITNQDPFILKEDTIVTYLSNWHVNFLNYASSEITFGSIFIGSFSVANHNKDCLNKGKSVYNFSFEQGELLKFVKYLLFEYSNNTDETELWERFYNLEFLYKKNDKEFRHKDNELKITIYKLLGKISFH